VSGSVSNVELVTNGIDDLAHGVAPGAESIPDFVWLGFTHMVTGWDHLLFIAGVVLLAWRPGRALSMVSLFALGHSVTLLTATLAGWRFDPEFVDVVFVLVHGLGLATRFQALAVPDSELAGSLIAFNVGVEFGQLAAVYVIYLVGEVIAERQQWPRIEQAGFAGLAAVGLLLSGTSTLTRL
jgi:hypothetical protein